MDDFGFLGRPISLEQDQDSEQERHDRRRRIDDQLPGVAETEHRPRHRPDEDDQGGDEEGVDAADPLGDAVRPALDETGAVRGVRRSEA